MSGSESDDSVGLPDDTFVIHRSTTTEEIKEKKKKHIKEFDPEGWKNEPVKGFI